MPTGGEVWFEGTQINAPGCDVDQLRRKMGMVFQHFNLFPHLSVLKNITLAPVTLKLKSEKEAEDKAMQLLKRIGLQDKANAYPSQLSGGQQQRIAIVRALAMEPDVMLFDEPTSGLDPVVRNEILDIFQDFILDEECSILLSTHITSDLEHIADYLAFIDNGHMIFFETRDKVLDSYGILKCDQQQFERLEPSDVIRYRKNRYNYEVLVSDRHVIRRTYRDAVIEKITIENLMLLYIKGEEL